MTERPDLSYRIPKVVIAPLEGNDAKAIYDKVPEALRVGTRYDEKTKTVIGSTNLLAVGVDDVVQSLGLRTLNLADLSLPEVMEFARGNHYIDARTLVARSLSDSYKPNNALLKRIHDLAEDKVGSVKFPFMIEGFSYVPDGSQGYGVTIVPKSDFRVIQDERLQGRNGQKFSEVDETGIPKFDRNGNRTWYAKSEGLSRLYLVRYLSLDSDDDDLAGSVDNGRVVLRTSEAGSPQNLQGVELK